MGDCNNHYVAKGGAECPYCHAKDIEGVGTPQFDGSIAWMDIRCNVCQKMWRDLYELKGYEDLDDEGKYATVQLHGDDPSDEELLKGL